MSLMQALIIILDSESKSFTKDHPTLLPIVIGVIVIRTQSQSVSYLLVSLGTKVYTGACSEYVRQNNQLMRPLRFLQFTYIGGFILVNEVYRIKMQMLIQVKKVYFFKVTSRQEVVCQTNCKQIFVAALSWFVLYTYA